jgi:hypothetical protein
MGLGHGWQIFPKTCFLGQVQTILTSAHDGQFAGTAILAGSLLRTGSARELDSRPYVEWAFYPARKTTVSSEAGGELVGELGRRSVRKRQPPFDY